MPISILGITSLSIDVIDMIDTKNLEYTSLLHHKWFMDNNGIMNSKT